MLKFRKMRHVRFFLNETLSPLSGVLLVRFLSLVTENEHIINTPINSNLSNTKTTADCLSSPPLFCIAIIKND